MNESKESRVTIRFNEAEKELLTEEANKIGMSLSQYVRYKALEEDFLHGESKEPNKASSEFLEKHIAKMARVIIDGYFHIKALAYNQLSEEESNEALELAYKEIEKMGISKRKENAERE